MEESSDDTVIVSCLECPSSTVTETPEFMASPLVAFCPQSFACGSSFSSLSERLHM